MLFKQSKNSFIRSTEKYGYVTNQLTQFDRVYNSTGADFLRMVSREPRSVEDAVEHQYTDHQNEETKSQLLLAGGNGKAGLWLCRGQGLFCRYRHLAVRTLLHFVHKITSL